MATCSLFCCIGGVRPYMPKILLHEQKFKDFLVYVPKLDQVDPTVESPKPSIPIDDNSAYAVQLVRQVNYGPLESIRWFMSTKTEDGSVMFFEIDEKDLIEANFDKKLNSFKNYRCQTHNKFFELNIYQKNPVNAHHWRANIARPASEIDLPPRQA